MESMMITPITQPMVSVASLPNSENSTTKAETQTLQHIKVEGKVKDQESVNENIQIMKPEEVSEEFNEMSNTLNLDVKFAYNEKIDEVYINVTDKNTGRVIRKLPTEEAMKIKESMKDLVGVLFDKKG